MASTTALPSLGTPLVPDVHVSFEEPENRFAPATIDSSPVLPGTVPYLYVGDELFIPPGVHGAIEQPIYQSIDGSHYTVLHADDTLAPIKVLKEVIGGRRVFGLHEWHYGGDGRGGFALTRDGGGPSEREIEAMALTQSQRLALLAGASQDLQAKLDEWADDPNAEPGERRDLAAKKLKEYLEWEDDKSHGPYNAYLSNLGLKLQPPPEVLNRLTKCVELTFHNSELQTLKLDNRNIQRLYLRNNQFKRLELGPQMTKLEFVDAANNRLDEIPKCLAALSVANCEVFLRDNPIQRSEFEAYGSSGAATGLRVTGAIPTQTTQDLKSLSPDEMTAEFAKLTDPKDWCPFLHNLTHAQRAWLMRDSAHAQRLQRWLGVDDTPPSPQPSSPRPASPQDKPVAPAEALVLFMTAMCKPGGQDYDQRERAFTLLENRLRALKLSEPEQREQRWACSAPWRANAVH